VVGVKSQRQGRPFLDDANTRVTPAVDPTLVSLG
jgi:hypothetical protein